MCTYVVYYISKDFPKDASKDASQNLWYIYRSIDRKMSKGFKIFPLLRVGNLQ